ncbi:MAG: Fic family protein [Chitinophagaceae bacterium]|nr:Fic family protein [Chitinophagaceae bacterium]
MDIKDFKAGNLVSQPTGYKCFMPNIINQTYTWSEAGINTLLEKATLQLGALNSFSQFVPDIDLFIRMHVVKEATESSRIEGTQTNIEDALVKQSDINPEKRDDWQEVNNYINAMNHAIPRLQTLPLSSRLLKETHAILLDGVRGEHKLPGHFRSSQNWIGGASLNDAVFIPPPHHEVDRLMGDLENFLHNDGIAVPHLVKIAVAHYQFETIHPFLDGNGRIGRLLITLYLIENKIIDKPILYLSEFFEKHKNLYYDNLTNARRKNDMLQWIRFFLEAIIQTCDKASLSLKKIMQLRQDCEGGKIIHFGKKAPNAKKLLDYLFTQPVVTAQQIAEVLGFSLVSSYKIIDNFIKAGILHETTGFKRNRFFIFKEYLQIFHT